MPEKFDANPKTSFMEFFLHSKEGTFHQCSSKNNTPWDNSFEVVKFQNKRLSGIAAVINSF